MFLPWSLHSRNYQQCKYPTKNPDTWHDHKGGGGGANERTGFSTWYTGTDIAFTESKVMEGFFAVIRLNQFNGNGMKFLNELKIFDSNDATAIDSSSL